MMASQGNQVDQRPESSAARESVNLLAGGVGPTTDNEATNCSETMSDYLEELNLPTNPHEPYEPSAEHFPLPVRNRVSTPRRACPPMSAFANNPGDIQQSDTRGPPTASALGELGPIPIITAGHTGSQAETPTTEACLTTDRDTPTEATLSLTSGMQAPPSYGTACAQLDVAQLQANLTKLAEAVPANFQNDDYARSRQTPSSQSNHAVAHLMDTSQPSQYNNNNNNNAQDTNNANNNANNHFAPATGSSPFSLCAAGASGGPQVSLPSSQTISSLHLHTSSNYTASQSHQYHQAARSGCYGIDEVSLQIANPQETATTYQSRNGYSNSLPRVHWIQQAQLQQQQQQQQLERAQQQPTSGPINASSLRLQRATFESCQPNLGSEMLLSQQHQYQMNSWLQNQHRQQQQQQQFGSPTIYGGQNGQMMSTNQAWQQQQQQQQRGVSRQNHHSHYETATPYGSLHAGEMISTSLGRRQAESEGGLGRFPRSATHTAFRSNYSQVPSDLMERAIRSDFQTTQMMQKYAASGTPPSSQVANPRTDKQPQIVAGLEDISQRSNRRHNNHHQQQQMQTLNRKRRRHKSASGRNNSPDGPPALDENSGTIPNHWKATTPHGMGFSSSRDNQTKRSVSLGHSLSRLDNITSSRQSANGNSSRQSGTVARTNKQTISAHCWLIDTSDDQSYAKEPSRTAAGRRHRVGDNKSIKKPEKPHLTVAMTKQSQERSRQVVNCATSAAINNPVPSADGVGKLKRQTSSVSSLRQGNQQDLTDNLKTNSLRMERILSRNNQDAAASSNRGNRGIRPYSASSTTSGSSSSDQTAVARTVVRLSALLSLMSSLLKRAPRCLKVGSSVTTTPENRQPAQASSVSGSLAPYTAGSLAISSSSSTSAYATGSSHLSTSSGPFQRSVGESNVQLQNSSSRPIVLSRLTNKQPNGNLPASSGSVAGSSMFYSSSGLSVPMSWHAYDYCEEEPTRRAQLESGTNLIAYQEEETQFSIDVKRLAKEEEASRTAQARLVSSSSSSSSSSAASDNTSSSSSSGGNGLELSACEAARSMANPNAILSDHELISVNSDLNGLGSRSGGFAEVVFSPASLVANAVGRNRPAIQSARRRWWWLSVKNYFQSPCNNSDSNLEPNSVTGQPEAKYKSLKSSRKSSRSSACHRPSGLPHPHRSGSDSTLQNVIALAKADRDFRLRLLASIVVSCILIGLILLWASIVHSRSSLYYQTKQPAEDGLVDFDLSWLWPQQQRQSGKLGISQFAPTGNLQPSISAANKLLELQVRSPLEQLDSSLRGRLLLIEQSERLNQFQQTMKHLTNIQLANDNFIDIIQVARSLPTNLEPPAGMSSADYDELVLSTPTSSDTSGSSKIHHQHGFSRVQLSELDHDLVSLTLLSNLHWPLVKWRHQNQQSLAHFLSFVMSPPASFAGSQTLHNLLSILLLIDSTPSQHQQHQQNNLQQFARLNGLLRGASYNIVTCVGQLNLSTRHNLTARLRYKFCKQLLNRYRRMMITLSQLNHSHLAKLASPSGQPTNNLQTGTTTPVVADYLQLKSSRTLIGFFLDRLSLLDVQMIAESVLVNREPDELEAPSEINDDSEHLIESIILKRDEYLQAEAANAAADWPALNGTTGSDSETSKQMPLVDFSKLIVGEGPLKLNLNLEKNRQLQEKFQQAEAEENLVWREQLAQDLLYPWPSFKLPSTTKPLSYNLFLHPNLTSRLVLGMVKIEFLVDRPTRYIVLNCDRLNLVDLSLWQKVSAFAASKAADSQASVNLSSNIHDTLRPIPIRRMLTNSKLEQIYLELEGEIEPETKSSPNQQQQQQQQPGNFELGSRINFGELSQILAPGAELSRENRFVLNISFNKTSLMSNEASGDPEHLHGEEPGLRFVQYVDYFAQPEVDVKTVLYTQFEPTNARRLFPCFDEPKFKAKFQLDLVHDQSNQVLFNAPKRERVPYSSDGATQMSVFETTPIPISTYLMSFIVCDNQNIKSITSRVAQLATGNGEHQQQRYIQVQILSQFEHLSQAEFASQLVPQLLNFYQNHLQVVYPMEKLDLMAIPNSAPYQSTGFKSNPSSQWEKFGFQRDSQQSIDTMENFGLIWFKAPLLLIDANLISQNLIEQISMIISHQIAHQYFGNIIGLSNWQDLWLYEALCQYLESVALASVQADWRLDEQFVVTSIQETLALEQFDNNNNVAPQVGSDLLTATAGSSITPTAAAAAAANQLRHLQAQTRPPASLKANNVVDVDLGSESEESLATKLQQANISLNPLELVQDRLSVATKAFGEVHALDEHDHDEWGQRPEVRNSNLVVGVQTEGDFASKQSAAVLHMLMLNLLPSVESQAKLLRKCLNVYRYKTMNQAQFWYQFGQQLRQEANLDRLSLELPPSLPTHGRVFPPTNSFDDFHKNNMSQPEADQQNSPSERVVFVQQRKQGGDVHKISVRSHNRFLVDNMELVANSWFQRHGYPLVTASLNRDRIILRQERFSFVWWNSENGEEPQQAATNTEQQIKWSSGESVRLKRDAAAYSTDDPGQAVELAVWPIPLMYLSRLNPKQARFFWMNKREMEIPLIEPMPTASRLTDLVYTSSGKIDSNSKRGAHYYTGSNIATGPGNWFKLNVNQSSLVRVNYDERNWEALTELLMKSHYSNHLLSSLDRANLIDDSLTLMRCGKLSVGVAMNLTVYLEVGERDYMPWTSAFRHLDQMQSLLNQNPLWHRYVLKLLQPISSVIGWKDDGPHLMRKLRRTLFSVALQYGDEKTLNKAKQEFKGWLKSGRFIVPNLQELVYIAGVRYGDQQEWFHCWQKYQQLLATDATSNNQTADLLQRTTQEQQQQSYSRIRQLTSGSLNSPPAPMASSSNEFNSEPNVENEKRQLLTALASTHNTWLLEQFLNYSLDASKVQANHLKHVMQTLGKNPVARLYLWRFVRLNWASLLDRHVEGGSGAGPPLGLSEEAHNEGAYSYGASTTRTFDYHQVLEAMIVESTRHFATKLDYEEVRTFFDGKRKLFQELSGGVPWRASIERAIGQSLQVISGNIYWRDYIEPKLTKWLSHYDS